MRILSCLIFLSFLMSISPSAQAQSICTIKTSLEAIPDVAAWHKDDARKPDCAGLLNGDFSLYVSLVGKLPAANSDDILERFGAVSLLRGLPYWSFSENRRETMIRDAFPVTSAGKKTSGSGFTIKEMMAGHDLFYRQTDNRSAEGVTYRMRVMEHAPHRLLIAVENVSSVRFLFMTLFQPGDLQTVYLLEQAKDRTWRYYNLTGIRGSGWTTGHGSEKSYMSRALSMFSHFAGMTVADTPPLLGQKA